MVSVAESRAKSHFLGTQFISDGKTCFLNIKRKLIRVQYNIKSKYYKKYTSNMNILVTEKHIKPTWVEKVKQRIH